MVKTICICDKCGKEDISQDLLYILPRIQMFGMDDFLYRAEMHLCYDCAMEIGKEIGRVIKKE